MGRLGEADEVAATAAWLLSGESSFITGAVISGDGGRLASGA
jgi:NAD(P)-dependent dehydrogenase (short-subunit alcohol dehydrogenase family)